MTRLYRAIGLLSVLAGASCFGLIVLASLNFVGSMRVAGVSLWPFVVLTLLASVFVASWAIAKAKSRSGWLGILLPFLDVIGIKTLFKLEDRTACRQRHEE